MNPGIRFSFQILITGTIPEITYRERMRLDLDLDR